MKNYRNIPNPITGEMQRVLSDEYVESIITIPEVKSIITVGTSGADYDNFDDAIDYLRTLNGGTIILISDMTITSTAIKDITNITIEGDLFYSGTRKINKTANGGYWYGKNVLFKNLWFFRFSDTGANEIFKYTEDYQDVTLDWVNCIGLGAMPAVFNCNGKEAHIIAIRKCALGLSDTSYIAFSNTSTLVANLFESSFIYVTGTVDAIWYDASSGVIGNPIYNTPDHPTLMDKVSAIENDSSVIGDTVKDALETLDTTKLTEDSEIKIKVYEQDTEPDLEDQKLAMWVDTSTGGGTYLLFRRGTGDQIKVELT